MDKRTKKETQSKPGAKKTPLEAIRNTKEIKIKSAKLKTPAIIGRIWGIGGGALAENNDNPTIESPDVYGMEKMTEILQWCEDTGKSYWEYVKECEEEDIWDYLAEVWATMKDAIHRGLEAVQATTKVL